MGGRDPRPQPRLQLTFNGKLTIRFVERWAAIFDASRGSELNARDRDPRLRAKGPAARFRDIFLAIPGPCMRIRMAF
jgi:hypothetical protein